MAAAYLRQLVPSLVRGPPGPAGPLPPPPPPPLFLKAEYPEVMHSKAGWVGRLLERGGFYFCKTCQILTGFFCPQGI